MRQQSKDEIRQIIQEEVRGMVQEELNTALTRSIHIRKSPPDSEPYNTTEEWNILDWFVHYIPYLEGAIRGCQEDVDKAKNEANQNTVKLQAIGQTLVGMEQAAKSLVELRDSVKQITNNPSLVIRQAIQDEGEQRVREAINASDNS